MADISKLSRLIGGIHRDVDLTANTLVLQNIKLNLGGANNVSFAGSLTANRTITVPDSNINLGHITNLQTLSGVAAGSNDLGAFTGSTIPDNSTVKAALQSLETAVEGISVTPEFSDADFRIQDDGDATKQIAFQASGISTATTRTITMPDADVNLADANNALLRDGSRSLNNNVFLKGRNAANTSDINILRIDSSDNIQFRSGGIIDFNNAGLIKVNGIDPTTDAEKVLGNSSLRWNYINVLNVNSAGDVLNLITTGNNANIKLDPHGTGVVDVSSARIANLAAGVNASDAVTKSQLDNAIEGVKPKEAVRAATTANISLSGLQTVDGVSLLAGYRVLVKNQTNSAENGIYIVAAGAWTRATDFDQLTPINEIRGSYVAVSGGTTQAGQVWVCNSDPATLDTDPITFVYFNSITTLNAGDGIDITGTTISVDHDGQGLQFVSGQLSIELDGSTLSKSSLGLKVATAGITDNELATNLDISKFGDGSVSNTEFQYINSLTSNAQDQLDGKANTTLSNLGLTSINANLLPSGNLTRQIGASGLAFSAVYTALLAHTGNIAVNQNFIPSGNNIIDLGTSASNYKDVHARKVVSADVLTLDGTSISASSKQIKNVSNPTDPQDAATKAYVDASIGASDVVRKTLVAGESFAADTTFLVRFARTGETAGRVYKADNDASTNDNFYVVGVAYSASAVSAGDNLTVIVLGEHTLLANDTAFASGDVGKPVFLDAAGAFTVTAPTGVDEAIVRVGMVQATNKIWVQPQVVGVA